MRLIHSKPLNTNRQTEVDYEDVEQIKLQPVLYEEVITTESCPAYASTKFIQPETLNDTENQYEEVNH